MKLQTSLWHYRYHYDIIDITMTLQTSLWHYRHHYDITDITMKLQTSLWHYRHHYDITDITMTLQTSLWHYRHHWNYRHHYDITDITMTLQTSLWHYRHHYEITDITMKLQTCQNLKRDIISHYLMFAPVKFFEAIMKNRKINIINKTKPLYRYQFGLRRGDGYLWHKRYGLWLVLELRPSYFEFMVMILGCCES